MNTELLDRIEKLAGCQRAKTFRKAAEFILEHNFRRFVETGCYRGNPADGQSTLILALLARELEAEFVSIDLNPEPIESAKALLNANDVYAWAEFVQGDSVVRLSAEDYFWRFAYLDSYDHEPHNPGPCQRHQLAEVGALLGKMVQPCAILLDDHVPETGGKTALSAAFLKERGWTLATEGYQMLWTLM